MSSRLTSSVVSSAIFEAEFPLCTLEEESPFHSLAPEIDHTIKGRPTSLLNPCLGVVAMGLSGNTSELPTKQFGNVERSKASAAPAPEAPVHNIVT